MNDTHASPPPSAEPGDELGVHGAADADVAAGAGSLVMTGTEPAVRFQRLIASPPQAVWRSLTDPEVLRAWFPCSVSAQRWEVGGALTFEFPGHAEFTMDGVVLECDPPRTLAYLWGAETLRYELTPVPSGTRLVMVDELSASIAARNAAGWHLCLDRLARRAPGSEEGGGDWRRLFALYSAAFEPTLGPQEGPPAGFEDDA